MENNENSELQHPGFQYPEEIFLFPNIIFGSGALIIILGLLCGVLSIQSYGYIKGQPGFEDLVVPAAIVPGIAIIVSSFSFGVILIALGAILKEQVKSRYLIEVDQKNNN
jgi:hypothetical protein